MSDSKHFHKEYIEGCPGCRPAVVDLKTGERAKPGTPLMQVVDRVWEATSLEERKAFFFVTCHNSRQPEHLRLFFGLQQRIQAGLGHLERVVKSN